MFIKDQSILIFAYRWSDNKPYRKWAASLWQIATDMIQFDLSNVKIHSLQSILPLPATQYTKRRSSSVLKWQHTSLTSVEVIHWHTCHAGSSSNYTNNDKIGIMTRHINASRSFPRNYIDLGRRLQSITATMMT